MSYIINEAGVMVSIPNNSPLPVGARRANDDEVRDWLESEKIRAAAGIPAPKSPEQAQLEHQALLENIERRGGLATPQEITNLNITGEQAGAAAVNVQNEAPVTRSKRPPEVGMQPKKADGETETGAFTLLGKGASAGDQYTQYETVPGVAKVVTDESAAVRPSGRVESTPVESTPQAATPPAETPTRRAAASDVVESSKPPVPDAPNDSPSERAANSPTAKSKEK